MAEFDRKAVSIEDKIDITEKELQQGTLAEVYLTIILHFTYLFIYIF